MQFLSAIALSMFEKSSSSRRVLACSSRRAKGTAARTTLAPRPLRQGNQSILHYFSLLSRPLGTPVAHERRSIGGHVHGEPPAGPHAESHRFCPLSHLSPLSFRVFYNVCLPCPFPKLGRAHVETDHPSTVRMSVQTRQTPPRAGPAPHQNSPAGIFLQQLHRRCYADCFPRRCWRASGRTQPPRQPPWTPQRVCPGQARRRWWW